MASKIVNCFLIALAIAASGISEAVEKNDDYDSHPSYSFNYNVHDDATGDIKSQAEQRDGDFVKGQYSLQEPDGYRRTVEYTADSENGFKATVRREQVGEHVKVLTADSLPEQILQHPKNEVPKTPSFSVDNKITSAYIHTFSTPTLLHHTPPQAIFQQSPAAAVHLTPTTHYVHTAPDTAPAVITHAIHSNTHPSAIKTSFSAPHISYVY